MLRFLGGFYSFPAILLVSLITFSSQSVDAVAEEAFTGHPVEQYILHDDNKHVQAARIAYTVAVGGLMLLSYDTCGVATTQFTTRFFVTQKGRKFFVQTPSGLRLKGKGGARGFIVSTRQRFASGLSVFHELRAGAIIGGRAAFRLSLTQRAPNGAQCVSVYTGTLYVGV